MNTDTNTDTKPMPRHRQRKVMKPVVFCGGQPDQPTQPTGQPIPPPLQRNKGEEEVGASSAHIPTAALKDSPEPPMPPYIPQTWASSQHPGARPPSPNTHHQQRQLRRPKMSSSVVDSVLASCKRIDPGAELASATFTQDGETLVRIRTGLTCSINSLKQAICNTMPLCGTEVVDSPLDGTTEIGVIVPTQTMEIRAARNLIRKKTIPRVIGHIGFVCFVFGLCAWLVSLVESLSASDAREL